MITGMRLGSDSSNSFGSVVMTSSPTPIRSEEPKRQTARKAIDANIQSIIDAVRGRNLEALTAYLNAMSRFYNYSSATFWRSHGRSRTPPTSPDSTHGTRLGGKVKKGEHGIRTLAPIVGVRRKPEERSASATHTFSIPENSLSNETF